MESEGEFNMHDRVQNINGILKRIRQMNERDALRLLPITVTQSSCVSKNV